MDEMTLRAHLHATLDHALETSKLIDGMTSAHVLDTSTGMIRGAIAANEDWIARQLKVRRETPAIVEEVVPFCGCTNEELEAGRTCGQPQCPNRNARMEVPNDR